MEPAGDSQKRAWHHCFLVLRDQLRDLCDGYIVFEYELPRERGRRPDVVILIGGTVFVLEFKDYRVAHQAHIDQVAAYARDLRYYHAASHSAAVVPILVLTESLDPPTSVGDVRIVGPKDVIVILADGGTSTAIDPTVWLASDYAPLPTLVAAARTIFQHEPLPQIRRAHSAGIPETIAELIRVADEAQSKRERHLALVTGVPGAGKTLVGLQFVYSNHFEGDRRAAVFLSGNDPLVKVLQHALESTVFVQDVHGFLKTYGGKNEKRPEEHIWIYDEAQRAWDAERVRGKRGHGASEPEDFLRLGTRMDSWAMVVGLIGEGQEIHLGEEAGLAQWNEAITAVGGDWTVHGPAKLAPLFNAANVVACDQLDLTTSLRSHLAEDVQTWVRQLLNGELAAAAETARIVAGQGFEMYMTRDFEAAKAYPRERYAGNQDKRYGLLASSKAKNLEPFGVRNGFGPTRILQRQPGPWYNDAPESHLSCCALYDVATEFASQGLELDFPVVAWGNDLTWNGSQWASPPQPRSRAHDPHRLRVNSYRVLLSRGRMGLLYLCRLCHRWT
jgi:hypothetical protein